ncbi:hypothetical protein SMD22_01065 (plasmid) [Brevibacillus halotolerans]|nr:hypothetical protein SMD22_01065 [Brevibacillus halotolerans]
MLKRITSSIVAFSLVFGMTVFSFSGEIDVKTVNERTVAAYTFGENG